MLPMLLLVPMWDTSSLHTTPGALKLVTIKKSGMTLFNFILSVVVIIVLLDYYFVGPKMGRFWEREAMGCSAVLLLFRYCSCV